MAAAAAALPHGAPHHKADQEEQGSNRHHSEGIESRLDVLSVVGHLHWEELWVGSRHGDVLEVLQNQEADSVVSSGPSSCAKAVQQPRETEIRREGRYRFRR